MQRHYLGGPLSPRGVRNAFLVTFPSKDANTAERALSGWYATLTREAKTRHEIQWLSATGIAYTPREMDTARVQQLLEDLMNGLRAI
ncbi:hypothetical protein [Fodinicola feengrottensis]|uniref:Uncharacterized protein n=1 Tax=Fodinicola feengrottensis TaxID=435914 RepID=A0ABP4UJL0_9ACTN|nr:hypothetical protein [Fodinicola feengrottensis]